MAIPDTVHREIVFFLITRCFLGNSDVPDLQELGVNKTITVFYLLLIGFGASTMRASSANACLLPIGLGPPQ
jgi:hypothetical protein